MQQSATLSIAPQTQSNSRLVADGCKRSASDRQIGKCLHYSSLRAVLDSQPTHRTYTTIRACVCQVDGATRALRCGAAPEAACSTPRAEVRLAEPCGRASQPRPGSPASCSRIASAQVVSGGRFDSVVIPTIPSTSGRFAFPIANDQQKDNHCGYESPPHRLVRHQKPYS